MEKPTKDFEAINLSVNGAPEKTGNEPPAAGYPTPQQQYGYPPPQNQPVFGQPQQQYGYPPPQNQPVFNGQPQQGYGQPQPGIVAQPGVMLQASPMNTTVIPPIGLPSIAKRSLVTGVVLLLVGFGYFILGCISSAAPNLAAEGIIIGLLNMASGIAGILMKFKLLKLETVDSLINYTWIFICFGAISLATAFGAFKFVVARVIIVSSGSTFRRLVREYGYAAASFARGTSAAATTFVLVILICSILMLTCSGSIRNRLKAAFTTGAVLRQ